MFKKIYHNLSLSLIYMYKSEIEEDTYGYL